MDYNNPDLPREYILKLQLRDIQELLAEPRASYADKGRLVEVRMPPQQRAALTALRDKVTEEYQRCFQ